MRYLRRLFWGLLPMAVLALASGAYAQTSSIFTTGLTTPNKIIIAGDNSLLVTEAGTRDANSGRISIIDRHSGDRQTLINGLPSAVSNLGSPAGDPDGPSGLLLRGRVLYVTIGIGDAVVRGPSQGQERVNPTPSSPLFDSVLELLLPGDYESLTSPFTLHFTDQATLANGGTVLLTNADGQKLGIRMVANLPNYIPAPLPPPNEDNVKASHLYGVEIFQKALYVVDAGHNNIKRIDLRTGDLSIFTRFPDRANPMFPGLGGPYIEAVPDNIHRFGNRLLVPLLTGFPFVPGLSEVRSVDLRTGDDYGLIPNLTSAIDVMHVDSESTASLFNFNTGGNSSFYTLEFSTHQFPPPPAPGRLRFYSNGVATPVDILTNLITPTSMARDEETRDIFITNIGPGTVTRVSFSDDLGGGQLENTKKGEAAW